MLIEYAKESLGVKYEGKQIGFFCNVGYISFNRDKIII